MTHRLDALMMVLKSCKRRECTDPWAVLHPEGGIKSLKDALVDKYDAFYHAQPKVAFTSCELGYLKDAEGPQNVNVFDQKLHCPHKDGEGEGAQRTFQYRGPWHAWT